MFGGFLLCVVFVYVCCDDCPDKWYQYKDHCYWPSTSSAHDRRRAERNCENKGGYLTEIGDRDENDFIARMTFGAGTGFFIGIVHEEKSGGYVTASNSSELEYSNWQEIVTARPSCTRMGYLGYWESYLCDEKQYFICERIDTGTGFFIGIVHEEKSGGYVTASNSSELEYSNWQEIVTARPSCTRMGYLGYWESYLCDEKQYFICESGEYIDKSSFGIWNTRTNSYIYDGHYYRTVSLKATYDDAQKKCKKAGAYLVEPNSEAENIYVHDKMREPFHTEWYFIGGSDTDREGYFVWRDNQALTFENWWPGEPNDKYYEDCIEMRYWGKWNDVTCRHFSRYICEKYVRPNKSEEV